LGGCYSYMSDINSRRHDYFESTVMAIQEIESEQPDQDFINSYAANITILGNATAPNYSETMLEKLQNSQYKQALALAEALDKNYKTIYQNAVKDNNSTEESRERCLNAKKEFLEQIVEEKLEPTT